jgi:hypothetical protein
LSGNEEQANLYVVQADTCFITSYKQIQADTLFNPFPHITRNEEPKANFTSVFHFKSTRKPSFLIHVTETTETHAAPWTIDTKTNGLFQSAVLEQWHGG